MTPPPGYYCYYYSSFSLTSSSSTCRVGLRTFSIGTICCSCGTSYCLDPVYACYQVNCSRWQRSVHTRIHCHMRLHSRLSFRVYSLRPMSRHTRLVKWMEMKQYYWSMLMSIFYMVIILGESVPCLLKFDKSIRNLWICTNPEMNRIEWRSMVLLWFESMLSVWSCKCPLPIHCMTILFSDIVQCLPDWQNGWKLNTIQWNSLMTIFCMLTIWCIRSISIDISHHTNNGQA